MNIELLAAEEFLKIREDKADVEMQKKSRGFETIERNWISTISLIEDVRQISRDYTLTLEGGDTFA